MIDKECRDAPGPSPEFSRTDRARFDAAVMPNLDAAYNLARHLVRDPHDAEDLVQESVLRAIRFFGGFRGGDGRAWLLAIVRNSCLSHMRSRRARGERVEFDEEVHAPAPGEAGRTGPEEDLSRAEAAASVREALAGLPVEFREALVLRELEGLSYKEIARITGAPIGTVMSRLARGRRLLACALGAGPESVEPAERIRDEV